MYCTPDDNGSTGDAQDDTRGLRWVQNGSISRPRSGVPTPDGSKMGPFMTPLLEVPSGGDQLV